MRQEIRHTEITVEKYYIILETFKDLQEWEEVSEDFDSALNWISEKASLDCTTNHNTAFGASYEKGGEYRLISDYDGAYFEIEVMTDAAFKNKTLSD